LELFKEKLNWITFELSIKSISALLFLICLCGCSPQASFAHRLKGADRAVLTSAVKGYEDVRTTAMGDDLNKVILAVTHGRKLDRKGLAVARNSQIDFFQGSERLATVYVSGVVFWMDGVPYQDTTKTLEKLYQKAREEHSSMFLR